MNSEYHKLMKNVPDVPGRVLDAVEQVDYAISTALQSRLLVRCQVVGESVCITKPPFYSSILVEEYYFDALLTANLSLFGKEPQMCDLVDRPSITDNHCSQSVNDFETLTHRKSPINLQLKAFSFEEQIDEQSMILCKGGSFSPDLVVVNLRNCEFTFNLDVDTSLFMEISYAHQCLFSVLMFCAQDGECSPLLIRFLESYLDRSHCTERFLTFRSKPSVETRLSRYRGGYRLMNELIQRVIFSLQFGIDSMEEDLIAELFTQLITKARIDLKVFEFQIPSSASQK